jgi:protein phosphatase
MVVVGGVVVIGGGFGWYFGSQWLDDQYFVGARGNEIVVFQGLPTSLGPVDLFDVAKSTAESVSVLNAFQQGQVRDGIPVPSVDAGLKKIEELKTSANPDGKDEPTSQPSVSPSASPTPKPSR